MAMDNREQQAESDLNIDEVEIKNILIKAKEKFKSWTKRPKNERKRINVDASN